LVLFLLDGFCFLEGLGHLLLGFFDLLLGFFDLLLCFFELLFCLFQLLFCLFQLLFSFIFELDVFSSGLLFFEDFNVLLVDSLAQSLNTSLQIGLFEF
jgi:hypothetical protein